MSGGGGGLEVAEVGAEGRPPLSPTPVAAGGGGASAAEAPAPVSDRGTLERAEALCGAALVGALRAAALDAKAGLLLAATELGLPAGG